MAVILIELVLVLGVALGIGFWQLYDVNKALKEDDEREARTASSTSDDESDPGA